MVERRSAVCVLAKMDVRHDTSKVLSKQTPVARSRPLVYLSQQG